MSSTIWRKSPVASGWKTMPADAARLDALLRVEPDVGGRDGEEPVGRRPLDLALAQQRVEEAHAPQAYAGAPCSCASRRERASMRFSIGGWVEKRL